MVESKATADLEVEVLLCPHCLYNVYASWSPLQRVNHENGATLESPLEELVDRHPVRRVKIEWMVCPNDICQRLIIRAVNLQARPVSTTMLYPNHSTRPVDPAVSERYADDYRQAAAILDASPKASAALSRRILADLLEEHAGLSNFRLSARIDAFIEDTRHPRQLRENLHYLREIADFGAHTQKDNVSGEVIDVGRDEAEWCLDVIDRLFDYFIIGPARDQQVRSSFDEKLSNTGRKPINPLPPDK